MVYAMTGISVQVLDDLERYGRRTFEVTSANNVFVAMRLSQGDLVFLTRHSAMDLEEGIEGILAEVLSVNVGFKREYVPESDEIELLSARLKVRFVNWAYVEEVQAQDICCLVILSSEKILL